MLKRFGSTGTPLQARNVADFCRLARLRLSLPRRFARAVHDVAMGKDEIQRALTLARLGQWDLVATGFAEHVQDHHSESDPAHFQCLSWHLLSLLESGDLSAYRVAADKLLSRMLQGFRSQRFTR